MNELGCGGTRTGKSTTTQPISCFPTSRALACMGFRLARCLFPQYSALAGILLFRNIPPLRARDSVWPPCITEKSSSLRTPHINEMVLQVRAKRNPIHAGHTITERITPQGPEMTCSARVETQNFASLQHSPIVIQCNKNGRDPAATPVLLNSELVNRGDSGRNSNFHCRFLRRYLHYLQWHYCSLSCSDYLIRSKSWLSLHHHRSRHRYYYRKSLQVMH